MKNVLITRQEEKAKESAKLIEEAGKNAFILPLIRTDSLKFTLKSDRYDYIVLTSINAVKYFREYLEHLKYDKIFSVGKATKNELKKYGFEAQELPDQFSSEGLKAQLKKIGVKGKHILLPGPEKRSGDLPEYLAGKGAYVEEQAIYGTKELIYDDGYAEKFITDNNIDIITLASPSAAGALIKQVDNLQNYAIVSIGKTTHDYLRLNGIRSQYPERYTFEDLVELVKNL